MTVPRSAAAVHVCAALLIGLTVASLYAPIVSVRPFDDDNLMALAWVRAAEPADLLKGDPTIYPEWRPLPYAMLYAEHQWLRLNGVPVHFSVNLVLLAGCAWLVYFTVWRVTGAVIPAVIAGLAIVTDQRIKSALVVIIERQTTLACIFGLLALLMALPIERALSWRRGLAVAGLLLAAALSKEYGTAFGLSLLVTGALLRRMDLAVPGASALAAYAALRAVVTGGHQVPLCDEMWFFGQARQQCVGVASVEGVAQMAYNAAATTFNLFVRGFLSDEGAFALSRRRLLYSLMLLAPVLVALRRASPPVYAFAGVALANGLLGFALFRERNQIVGACAIAVLAGIGLTWLLRRTPARVVQVAAVALLLAMLADRGRVASTAAWREAEFANTAEPCTPHADLLTQDYAARFISRVKTVYGLPDPHCTMDW